MEVLKNKRYLAIGGIVSLFLAVLFPYYTYKVEVLGKVISEGKVSLIGYWEGYMILLCVIAIAVFIFMDFIEKYASFLTSIPFVQNIKNKNPKFVLVPIGIIILVSIYDMRALSKYSFTKFGLGFYLEIIGIICLVGHVILYKGATGITSSSNEQSSVSIEQQPNINMQQQSMMNQQPMQQPMMNQQPMQQPMMNQQPMQQPMMNQQPQQQPMNNNQFPNNNGF